MTERRAAHDQLVVHEEGRDDGHPEADALVHVQLTCGLAYYGVDHLFHHAKMQYSASAGALSVPLMMLSEGRAHPLLQAVAGPSAGR
jgi:hypothetical protein